MFFEGAVVDRVEVDLAGWFAVSDGSADPTGGVFFSFGFEKFFAFLEEFGVLAVMLLDRGDKVEGAMFVLSIVGGDETMGPFLGFGKCCKAVGRVAGVVFGGSEEGFGEGVVVADAGAGVGSCDFKLVHEAKDGGRFERAAIVSMKYERGVLVGDFFGEMSALQKGVGVVGVFFGEDFGADDFAAVEVEDEVEFVVDAADLGGQPGDVPGPDLVGLGGVMVGARFGFGGFAGATTSFVEVVLGEDPVVGGFRGKVDAFVEEGVNDLGRGRGGEAR